MRSPPPEESTGKSKPASPLARIHSPAVMLLLVFLLVVYLVYILAETYGIEGEGGWLGEVLGSALFIAGIIVAALVVAGTYLGIRTFFARRRGGSPWMDEDQTGRK